MLPDRVSNLGPLTYESGALPIAPRGPAMKNMKAVHDSSSKIVCIGSSEQCNIHKQTQ